MTDTPKDGAPPPPAPDQPKPDDATAKLAEFRANNRALFDQNKALQEKLAQYGDIDPETVKQALAAMSSLKDREEAELVKAGKIDDVLQRRTATMQEQFQKQVRELSKKLEAATKDKDALLGEYGGTRLRAELSKALDERKVRIKPGAFDDLLLRAERLFKLGDDRKITTSQTGTDGQPLTVADWVSSLVESAGHLFEGGEGGGAKPGTIGVGGVRYVARSSVSPADFAKISAEVKAGRVVLT